MSKIKFEYLLKAEVVEGDHGDEYYRQRKNISASLFGDFGVRKGEFVWIFFGDDVTDFEKVVKLLLGSNFGYF